MEGEKEIIESVWSKIEAERKLFVERTTDGRTVTPEGVTHLIETIISRAEFKYSTKDILEWFLCCMPCRARHNLRKWMPFNKHWHFVIGEEKMKREMDVIKLFKSIRDVRLLKMSLLN